jgi:cytochrome c-type biogenesis protein
MIGELLFAFAVGSVATVNPCGFALLPAYMARRVAVDDGAGSVRDKTVRALAAGAAMTVGVVLVFGIGGGAVVLGAGWLVRVFPWAGLAVGVILAAIGLAVLAGRRIALPLPTAKPRQSIDGPRGDLAFGVGFGTASLSCTLPIFLAVTGVAVTGGALASALSLVAYALGMGTVLTALAVAAALARGGLLSAAGRLRPYIGRASGALLFLTGLYVIYFWATSLFADALPPVAAITVTGARISTALRSWVGATEGQVFLYGLLGLLGAVTVWALRRRAAPPDNAAAAGGRSPSEQAGSATDRPRTSP